MEPEEEEEEEPESRESTPRPAKRDLHAAMVASRLFLGDSHAASDRTWLAENGIAGIVNCTPLPPAFPEDFAYFQVPVDDDVNAPVREYFESASAFITEQLEGDPVDTPEALAAVERGRWWAEGPCVLVHCQGGRSRSATVLLAHLLRSTPVPASLEAVFLQVTSARPSFPNLGFVNVLREEAVSLGIPLASNCLQGAWPGLVVRSDVDAQVRDGADETGMIKAAVRGNIRRWKTRIDKLCFMAPGVAESAGELRGTGFTLGDLAALAMVTACEDAFGAMHFSALRELLQELYAQCRDEVLDSQAAVVEMEAGLAAHLTDPLLAELELACPDAAQWVGRCAADAVACGVLPQGFAEEFLQPLWNAAASEATAVLQGRAFLNLAVEGATRELLLTSMAVQAGYKADDGELDVVTEATLEDARQRLAMGRYVPPRLCRLVEETDAEGGTGLPCVEG